MAVAQITGLTGQLTLPGGLVQRVGSLTINTGYELLDVSAFGGSGYRTRAAGLQDLSGTGVAFMTKGVSGSNPFVASATPSTMTITFDTGCTVTLNAIIGNISVVSEYAGLNVINFSWSHADDAAPTIAWVTSGS